MSTTTSIFTLQQPPVAENSSQQVFTVALKPAPVPAHTHAHSITNDVEHGARDPHSFPTFDSTTLTELTQPILYLPPLLSSLPERFPPAPAPNAEYPPLVTETRLPDIDPASLSLHKALHHFKPLNGEYAALPYEEAFNWAELELPEDDEREWYCVVFRSKRKAGSDSGRKSRTYLPNILLILIFLSLLSSVRSRQKSPRRRCSQWRGMSTAPFTFPRFLSVSPCFS